jgi:2-succinyl-5-enolpyruvyl-6-hydroxy-3-cyclohexene-1-carboxylate synthase
MIYPKIPLAQSVLEICKAKGIQHIVISPGSRNAPLTIGFTNNPYFTCYSIADERCAGFFGLGIAQQLQQPVAVVCTSGSALLNYYPAVAEAFYNEIPLVVISADRPHDKIDIGDGQTIRQENVFANHILYNANLTEESSEENDLKIQEALFLSITKKGPVHINAPFEEPLYETVEALLIAPTLVDLFSETKEKTEITEFATIWNRSPKKLVLLGGNYPNAIEQQFLDTLGDDESVVVMTEVTSNAHHSNFITNIDTIITPFTEEDFLAFQPEILVTVGGMIVSKRIKAFLRKYKPKHHWHIDELRAYNTFGCLTQHFQVKPNVFFSDFFKETIAIESNFRQKALEIRSFRAQKHQEYVKAAPFSDFKVFDTLLAKLPKDIQLQISNSSPIRYAQLFPIDKSIPVFCNRGTSGIDGSTTTAVGASVVNKKPTVFISGDISFFYDSNALWNNYIPSNFKIILINNSGGGIFRILPGHQENETFNTYFETSHNLTAEHIAKMYQFKYLHASNLNDIETNWELFLTTNQPTIFEIFTPEKRNNEVLLDYFKNLK